MMLPYPDISCVFFHVLYTFLLKPYIDVNPPSPSNITQTKPFFVLIPASIYLRSISTLQRSYQYSSSLLRLASACDTS